MSHRKAKRAYRSIGQMRGASLIEYALIAALASVVILIAVLAFLRT